MTSGAHTAQAAHIPHSGAGDPRVNLIVFATLVVAGVSTPRESMHAFAAYFIFLFAAAAILRVSIRPILLRAIAMEPFILFAAASMPFFKHEAGDAVYPLFNGILHVYESGLTGMANALLKGTLGVLSLSALSAATPFPSLLASLRVLRIPTVMIQIAAVMHRYIFVIGEEVERMKRARDSRGWKGTKLSDARVVGQMIGALFLRSYERAERVHSAMVSRGYEGAMPFTHLHRPGTADFVFCAASLALIILIRIAAS